MAGSFGTFDLGDVCTKIGSGATPRGGSSVYLDHGAISFIRSQNVHNDGFRREGLAFLTDKHAAELSNVEVQEHDILLNITGDSVARSCQVDVQVLPARVNQHVAIIRPDPKKLWPRFLRYFLVSHSMQAEMLSLAGSGATRNALTKGMIEAFQIEAPKDVGEQKAIADILGALDDKIELNRRMNATLEAIARAIFKSWFVDFDPVKAKAASRCPVGMDTETAALFPDSFQDSELGDIPRGWSLKTLADIIEILGGGTPKTAVPEYWGGDILWYSVADAPQIGDVFVVDTVKKITPVGLAESATRLLPYGTTIISARGTVGSIALVGKPMAMNQSCYGLRGRGGYGDYFTYFSTAQMVEQLKRRTHGSVFDTITRDTFRGIILAVPPPDIAAKFDQAVAPMLQGVLANLHQRYYLAALRNTLLPVLLSGKLRVRETQAYG